MAVDLTKQVNLEDLKAAKDYGDQFIAPVESSATASQAYAVGEHFWYGGKLYKATQDIANGDTITPDTNCTLAVLSEDIDNLGNEIDELRSDEGVVGNAEQLLSESGAEEQVPYNFRTSGGSADIGNRETDMVVGGTIAWNQLQLADLTSKSAIQGITRTASDDMTKLTYTGTATVTDNYTASSFTGFVPGHKILLSLGSVSLPAGVKITGSNVDRSTAIIIPVSNTGTIQISITINQGVTVDFSIAPQAFNLTKMFGSTIADHIYALEQANAGAGVAWFKALFPKSYYEYNVGELMSVNVSQHNMGGLNAWDEEWENGYYNRASGAKAGNTDTTYFRSKNYIHCIPSTSYYLKLPSVHAQNNTWFALLFYDADKNYLSNTQPITAQIITTPSNAYYMTFYVYVGTSGATYKNDICINLSWSGYRNGEYEPYEKHSYALDDSLTLRGIPKLDANNQLYYDGDTYESDGTVTRKYGIVDLGDAGLAYNYNGKYGGLSRFSVQISSLGVPVDTNFATVRLFSSRYVYSVSPVTSSASAESGGIDRTFCLYSGSVYILDNSTNSTATLKSALSGVYLVYELATPTTETATPYQNPQIVDDFGTEEYVDASYEAGTRDVAVPVGHKTLYHTNLRKRIEGLPDNFSTLIAPTERTFTATRAYAVKEFLIVDNQLYRVTANIANGAAITVGTNVVATNIGEILASLI